MTIPREPRPSGRSHHSPAVVVAGAAPLFVLASSFLLWALSDRLLYIGPLDRAAFGWAVVVPLWVAAPVAAAAAWRTVNAGAVITAAAIIGLLIALVGGVLIWQDLVAPGCQFGPVHTPAEWIVPAALPALVLGAGFTAGSLLGWRSIRAGRKLEAVVVGGSVQLGASIIGIVVTATVLSGPVCQRPPI